MRETGADACYLRRLIVDKEGVDAGVTTLSADATIAWAREAERSLASARSRLDAANVFPVADSDTGTNLWLTVGQGLMVVGSVRAARAEPAKVLDVLQAFARGCLDGARGNSGVILSEFLRGFALGCASWSAAAGAIARGSGNGGSENADGMTGLDAAAVCAGLEAGARLAHDAVGKPVPGTILTAAQWAARAARAHRDSSESAADDVVSLLAAAIEGASRAVQQSPDQLAVLAAAHVVDAGAVGLLLVLTALHAAVDEHTGEELPLVELQTKSGSDAPDRHVDGDGLVRAASDLAAREVTVEDGEFEVMYAVHPRERGAAGHAMAQLRGRLAAIGDSVIVVGESAGGRDTTGGLRVHVHTDDPAAAVLAPTLLGSGWTTSRAVIHQLAARPHRSWGMVGITRSPGLLAAIGRCGAVGLWVEDGRVDDDDLRRALVDAQATNVVVVVGRSMPDDSLAQRVLDVARGVGIEATCMSPPDLTTDAHLVAALAATEIYAGTTASAADPLLDEDTESLCGVVREAISAVRVVVDDGTAHRQTAGATERLLSAIAQAATGAEIVTVIADDGVPSGLVAKIVQTIETCGAEVVEIFSALPGTQVIVGIEAPPTLDGRYVAAVTPGLVR